MTEHLQDEVYHFKSNYEKGSKLREILQNFSKVLEWQKKQNQTVSELYTDDKKTKHSSNSDDILKSSENVNAKHCNKEAISKNSTYELFSKIPSRK